MPTPGSLRVLLDSPLVRTLERQHPPLEVLTHARHGQPHPVRLRDQLAHQPARPQLPAQPHVTGLVLEDGLPHRGPIDLVQHLVHTDRFAAEAA
ncbi:hypothetical protein [Streptomyces sp. NPDC051569]|uniref:hypothetical protein n=1 Tax=Streptomyces sp. NPDC051569 TaxID=3365661 RepID=UPI00379C31DF